MYEADFDKINIGDIVGLTMYNSVHNIGFVDDVSGRIIRLHTLIGQSTLAFSKDYAAGRNDLRMRRFSPESLNGTSAKGMSIGPLVELPDRIVETLRHLDLSLKNKSALQSKIIIKKHDDIVREALSIMREAALKPQIELPGLRL